VRAEFKPVFKTVDVGDPSNFCYKGAGAWHAGRQPPGVCKGVVTHRLFVLKDVPKGWRRLIREAPQSTTPSGGVGITHFGYAFILNLDI
jgi:hypothetical protein